MSWENAELVRTHAGTIRDLEHGLIWMYIVFPKASHIACRIVSHIVFWVSFCFEPPPLSHSLSVSRPYQNLKTHLNIYFFRNTVSWRIDHGAPFLIKFTTSSFLSAWKIITAGFLLPNIINYTHFWITATVFDNICKFLLLRILTKWKCCFLIPIKHNFRSRRAVFDNIYNLYAFSQWQNDQDSSNVRYH